MADELVRIGSNILEAMGSKPVDVRVSTSILEAMLEGAPSVAVSTVLLEVLLVSPPAAFATTVIEVMGERNVSRPPLYTDAVYSYATQPNAVPPISEVISKESLWTVWNYAVVQMPIDDAISYDIVGQSVMLAVQGLPIVTISPETVKQAWSYVVQESKLGNFPLPEDMWSKVSVAHYSMMVLQSIDIPYVPTSGVFAKQVASLSVQAFPLPMYHTPASVQFSAMLAAQKRPVERLPRSYTRVAQQLSQAATARGVEPLPRSTSSAAQVLSQAAIPANFDEHTVGVEWVRAVTSYALTSLPMSLPISYSRVGHESVKVLQHDSRSQTLPLSLTSVWTVASQLVVKSDLFPVISAERVKHNSMLVAQDSTDYLPPINMVVWSRADHVDMQVAQQATDYPDPSIPTTTSIVEQMATLFSQASIFDSPADIYEKSKVQYVPSVVELVPQRAVQPLPKSYTPIAQFVELVTAFRFMEKPGDIANSGVFISQITQPIAQVAEYPDPHVPSSPITVSQVIEHVAVPADYPDVHLPTSDAVVGQILEHVAQVDDFPDPANMFRPLIVSQVLQSVSQETTYPAWDTLHKPVSVSQIVEHVSVTAIYPDKDQPQSFVKVTQVLQQVADTANYPDKDAPQSTLRVHQVFETVMMRDLTMYVMPTPPRKHRVQISCRFVY